MVEQCLENTKEYNDSKLFRAKLLQAQSFKSDSYEWDNSPIEFDGTPETAHTTEHIIKCLESGSATIEAYVLGFENGARKTKHLEGKEAFLECFKKSESNKTRFRESFDYWGSDMQLQGSSLVGSDFTPSIMSPFYRQQYLQDYQKAQSACYYAFHHDPIGKNIVNVTRDFTLGRGFKVDCKDKTKLAMLQAFFEANDFEAKMDYIALELSAYGEVMIQWLPNNETYFTYNTKTKPSQGMFPRLILRDPAACWEIVTLPESIDKVLNYTFVYNTQYQMFTDKLEGEQVPTSKFIWQQVKADDIMHFKINCVSNEKRGRSDLFPALGYMKRLRDSVNYAVIAQQKNSAWAIDTKIEGSQADIDNYISSMEQLGTVAEAGSEFVHSSKVERQYLANAGGGGKGSTPSFEWCLSMIAAATQVPINYFGTHISNATTRASALVATEPVTKKFEMRQKLYEQIIKQIAKKFFKIMGTENEDIEVTFPTLIIDDRSQKLKDLISVQTAGYISRKRAAEIAAKELNITEFNYDEEMKSIEKEQKEDPLLTTPLTSGGIIGNGSLDSEATNNSQQDGKNDVSSRFNDTITGLVR